MFVHSLLTHKQDPRDSYPFEKFVGQFVFFMHLSAIIPRKNTLSKLKKNIFYFRIFLPWILSNSMTAFDSFMSKFVYGYNYYIALYIFDSFLNFISLFILYALRLKFGKL